MRDRDGVEWLTLTEAAARWGIPEGTLRKWRHRGKITAHRTPHGILVLAADVAAAEHATRGKYRHQRGRTRQVS